MLLLALVVTAALFPLHIILGTHAPTSGQSWAADVNEDGAVNIVDAVVLVNIILGG
ncbi:MAG: hypothetical protein JSV84_17305 [Gemmatimonadota bacterium]|nr:MAG: hypothetical protein JSV84_17305 [Gemmatimonadota bacterium]